MEYKIRILRVLSKTKRGLTKYKIQNLEVSDYDPSTGANIIHKRPDLVDKAVNDLQELGLIRFFSKERMKNEKMRGKGIYKITKKGKDFIHEKNKETLEYYKIFFR